MKPGDLAADFAPHFDVNSAQAGEVFVSDLADDKNVVYSGVFLSIETGGLAVTDMKKFLLWTKILLFKMPKRQYGRWKLFLTILLAYTY